ncbi:MAG: hypothetical protein E7551_03325 [Ruminococcaceae bacterium]|nr:hypothetical protein [Oscillospiraceae bacterium]
MLILFIYRYLFGYLYVRIKSENPEKLLNLCATNGIGIWRVSIKNNLIYFKIGIASFKKLRIFKRKVPCKIHITKKVGLPFFIAKNKKRYGFIAGFIIFIATIYFMSGLVWNICISGNKNIKSSEILASLNKIGIYEGAFIKDINPEDKRNELLLEQKGLSWAAINIEGAKVTVDVNETKASENDADFASNFVSMEDGVIKKIEVKRGITKVKVGDVVQKGQLLVSGVEEYDDGTVNFTRSMGNVYAEVNYSFETVQPLKVTEFIKTGEVKTRKILDFYGLKIPLFLGGMEEPYVTAIEQPKISSGNSYLPIKIISKRFYKTEETTYELRKEQAEARAINAAEERVKKLINNGEIITKNHTITTKGENLIVKTEIKCLKDVVFEEKLLLDTSN